MNSGAPALASTAYGAQLSCMVPMSASNSVMISMMRDSHGKRVANAAWAEHVQTE